MPLKVIILISSFLIISLTGGLYYYKVTDVSKDKEELLPLPTDKTYDQEYIELVHYQETVQDPYFHAPCPIPQKIHEDLYERALSIGFDNEPDKRQWNIILNRFSSSVTIEDLKNHIRNFIITLIKSNMSHSEFLFGASGSGDLNDFSRIAICDEIAIAHYFIKNGISSIFEQEYIEIPNLILSKEDRQLFETLYRSCRMTASRAHRIGTSFIRSAFYPEKIDWSYILQALKIDQDRPNELKCTYKKKL